MCIHTAEIGTNTAQTSKTNAYENIHKKTTLERTLRVLRRKSIIVRRI